MFRSVVKLAVVFVALGMLSVSVSCGKAPITSGALKCVYSPGAKVS